MEYSFFVLLSSMLAFFLGIVARHSVFTRDTSVEAQPVNTIPSKLPKIGKDEKNVIDIYQKEWERIIETQSHFNDLILRFRTIILTAFLTLSGVIIAVSSKLKIGTASLKWLIIFPMAIWVIAFILDFFYYQKMLIAAVTQAKKFDAHNRLRELGLFGMTTCISNAITESASRTLLFFYYGVPPVIATIMMLLYGSHG